jgi:membrane fusion protein (multidrug efflux system)
MRKLVYLLSATIILASCSADEKPGADKAAELSKLKQERTEIDVKIAKLETEVNKGKPGKVTPVTVVEMLPSQFTAYVEVQAQVNGEQSVNATPQAPGIISRILVRPGQHVGRGQTLATLDAAAIEQQIKAIEPSLTLAQTMYERQQKLWEKNIGSEMQLLQAKAQYEATSKQKAALQAQRGMYSIKSPISGVVDMVNIKEGDASAPGMNGIRVVSMDKLKIQANLGENYLGKVKTGDRVNLIFPDETIHSKLSYVSRAVDPVSRAFQVEVRLTGKERLHPNMSCKLQIANYENAKALVVPVSVIQKTAEGDMLYIAEGNKAKAVMVTAGHNSNGMVEIVAGLNPGDKVITEGYQELDNGETVSAQ